MVSKTSKWPVADIEVVNRWSSPSKNLILLGDAAHAMIPFMSIGEMRLLDLSCSWAFARTDSGYRSRNGRRRCCRSCAEPNVHVEAK